MTASKIEWTDEVWNPVTGCDRVSPGCDNCYAERIATRFHRPFLGAVELRDDRLEDPLHWRKPRRVFVNSVSDLFHPDVSDEYIGSVWDVMARTPRHTYQILTKRPQRMAKLLAQWAADGWMWRRHDLMWCGPLPVALQNVWLGVSVENQRYADLRIPHLLRTPAAVRFLSVEPLLGPVNLHEALDPIKIGGRWGVHDIDWVIVGGESGRGARQMHPDWARDVRDECVAAGVPFFFKQWGEWVYPDQMPEDCPGSGGFDAQAHRVGKKNAGRELDGRTWDEYPRGTDKETR